MTHVVGGAEDVVLVVLLYPFFFPVDHMNLWDLQRDKLRLKTV